MNDAANSTPQAQRALSFLEGVPFPVDKSELVAHASMRGAPEDVLDVLDNLPDISYGSLAKVLDEINSGHAEKK